MDVRLTTTGSLDPPDGLHEAPFRIGRHPEAEVRMDDPCVSRWHCQIEQVGVGLTVRDLGSKNGTFVNGLRVTEASLLPGDRLTVGRTSFSVEYERERGAIARTGHEPEADERFLKAGLSQSASEGFTSMVGREPEERGRPGGPRKVASYVRSPPSGAARHDVSGPLSGQEDREQVVAEGRIR